MTYAERLREALKDKTTTEAEYRMIIASCADGVESLTAENERLRKALQRTLDDVNENYDKFFGRELLIRNSTIEAIRETLRGA